MTSHEYANKLRELADFLSSKPEFTMPWDKSAAYSLLHYWGALDKNRFIEAVKAVGPGDQKWDHEYLIFTPSGTDMLRLEINRNLVCRKVQEEKWEYEPLLSQEEERSIGI